MNKYKVLKNVHGSGSEAYYKLNKSFLILNEEYFILKNNNYMLQNKRSKLKKENLSKSSTNFDDVIKKYDKSFQKFLSKSLNRSVMDSMIYDVSRSETRGIGYDFDEESTFEKYDKTKAHSQFNHAYMYDYTA